MALQNENLYNDKFTQAGSLYVNYGCWNMHKHSASWMQQITDPFCPLPPFSVYSAV